VGIQSKKVLIAPLTAFLYPHSQNGGTARNCYGYVRLYRLHKRRWLGDDNTMHYPPVDNYTS